MNQMIPKSSACLVMLLLVPVAVGMADDDAAGQKEVEPTTLSVAPLDHVEYPEARPEWVGSVPSLDELPHTWVIVSDPRETVEESVENLRVIQLATVVTYIQGLPGAGGRSDFFPISNEWIDDNLVIRRYSGAVTRGGVKQFEHAVEMRFDGAAQQEVLAAIKNVEVRDRLGALGVLSFGGLIGLICCSAIFGLLSRRAQRRDDANVSVA